MCVRLDGVKLAALARSVGVHPQTADAWVREGRMPVPFRRLPSCTILVDVAKPTGEQQRVVLYARCPAVISVRIWIARYPG
jgi:putative resolvase